MSPANSAEEVFIIPPPPWLVRVGLPVLALGPTMALVGFPWVFSGGSDGLQITCQVLGMVLLFVEVGVLTTSFGSRLTIGQYGVTLEKPRWTQSMLYSEVRCLRDYQPTGEAPYVQLEPLAPTGSSLRISSRFPEYVCIRQLLTTYVPDYDALAPGSTLPGQPTAPLLDAFPVARRWAWGLNLTAIGAAAWWLAGEMQEAATALALAVEVVAAGALWYFRGALQLSTDRGDSHPNVGAVFFISSLITVLFPLAGRHFVAYEPLWLPAAAAGGCMGLLLLMRGLRPSVDTRRSWHVGQALLLGASFGLGVAVLHNCAFGGLGPHRVSAQVSRKYKSYNKGTNYHLELDAWGPPGAPTDFGVRPAYYEHKQPGDTVSLRLYQGRLGADWVELAE